MVKVSIPEMEATGHTPETTFSQITRRKCNNGKKTYVTKQWQNNNGIKKDKVVYWNNIYS